MTTIDAVNETGEAVRIQIDGKTIMAMYSDALVDILPALGTIAVTRASHVEPYETSCIKGYGLAWAADMGPSGGPVLGPFLTRASALRAERDWLRKERGL